MSIVGAFDVHRRQLTFEYLDTSSGELKRGRVVPADRQHLRAWLTRFAGVRRRALRAGGLHRLAVHS
jgi:transposase